MKTAVAAVLMILALSRPTQADVLYSNAITLGPSYAIGPSAGSPWTAWVNEVGRPLLIVGLVGDVGAPFSDLIPVAPHELTCVFAGATCSSVGQWDDIPCSGGTFLDYTGGTMSIYLDLTPDADFALSSTFHDGELVLQAQLQTTLVTDDDPYENCPMVDDEPDVRSFFTFSGGSWFYRVVSHGSGLSGICMGELPGHYPDLVPEPLRALGYVLRIDGNMDIFGPVATTPSTWGYVKTLYR